MKATPCGLAINASSAERSDLASVEAALAAGANVNAKEEIEGYTALHNVLPLFCDSLVSMAWCVRGD